MRCATEKQCSDSSNFGNIMSSHQVQLLRPMLNLTDIASLKASYKSMCGKLCLFSLLLFRTDVERIQAKRFVKHTMLHV